MEAPSPEPSQLRLLTYMEIALGEKTIFFFGPWPRIRKNPATSFEIMLLARELFPCFEHFAAGRRLPGLKTSQDDIHACLWELRGTYALLLYRDRPSFSRYVDTNAVKGVHVELPLPDGEHFVALPLGVEPGKAELIQEEGTGQLRFESVELTAAVLILPAKNKNPDIRESQEWPSVAEAELCVRAAEFQLQKVRGVYERCALSLPNAEQAFRDAAREIITAKQLLHAGENTKVVALRRIVNRFCRRAVVCVMDHADSISPVPDSARPFAGLYYGMPNFFAATRDR